MAPFQFRAADQTSTCGRLVVITGGHRHRAANTATELCARDADTSSSPASSFAGAIVKSRATSSWRRQRRTEAAVNDATWQLVKKLVTLTVPLCESRLLKTPFWSALLFRGFFVSLPPFSLSCPPRRERRRRVPRYHLSSTFHTHSRTRTHLLPDPPARDLTRLITCTASTQRRLDDPAYREANEKLFQSVHLRPLRTIILLLARASPRFVPRIESNDNENIFIHIFRTRKIKRGRGGRTVATARLFDCDAGGGRGGYTRLEQQVLSNRWCASALP